MNTGRFVLTLTACTWLLLACGGVGTTNADAGTQVCVDNVLCIQGTHWDAAACACVPNSPPATGGSNGVCVDNVLCIRGTHWDSMQCKCVSN